MGKPTEPTFAQDGYRFRDAVPDPATLNTAFNASDTAANTSADIGVDSLYRVRIVIKQTNAAATSNASNIDTAFRLQYNNTTQGTGWVNVGTEGAGTDDVEFDTSSNFNTTTETTQLVGSGTFDGGHGCYSNETTTVLFTALTTTEAEMEFAFRINSSQVADGDTIQLRVLYSASDETPPATVLEAYTNYPTLTVDEPPPDQNVTCTSISDADTLGTHTVTPGGVSITATAIVGASTLGTATVGIVIPAQNVTGTVITNTSSVGTAVVTIAAPLQTINVDHQRVELIGWQDSSWYWDDSNTDYVTSSPPFFSADFDEVSNFTSGGQGTFYYGTVDNLHADTAFNTLVTSNLASYYLLQDITLTDNMISPQIEFNVDDGFQLWINGVEAYEYNYTATPGHSNFADTSIGTTDEGDKHGPFALPENLLRAGTNRIAILLKNQNTTSTDLGLDARFTGLLTGNANYFGVATVSSNTQSVTGSAIVNAQTIGGATVTTVSPQTITHSNASDLTFVAWKATGWRYDETNTNYLDSTPDWREATFDPDNPPGAGAAFETGQAALWRGLLDDLASETSLNAEITNGRLTYYLIYEFTSPTASMEEFWIEYAVDDGMIVYLNGTEIERDNYTSGPGHADAADSARTPEGNKEGPNAVADTALIAGTNRVAVLLKNNQAGSSDNVWDMHLYGTGQTGNVQEFGTAHIYITGPQTLTLESHVNENVIPLHTDVIGGCSTKSWFYDEVVGGPLEDGSTLRDEISSGDSAKLPANAGDFICCDDSNNTLFIVGPDGENNGTIVLTGATYADAEALVVTNEVVPRVIVGAIGDNNAVRPTRQLYIFKEPVFTGGQITIPATDWEEVTIQFPASPIWDTAVAYGDTETMFVADNKIYIISKREAVPKLFSMPLQQTYSGTQTMTYEGEIWDVPDFTTSYTANVLDGACDKNERNFYVKSYGQIWRWYRSSQAVDVPTLLATTPDEMPCVGLGDHPGAEPQGETLMLSADGRTLTTISESGTGTTALNFPLFIYNIYEVLNAVVGDNISEIGTAVVSLAGGGQNITPTSVTNSSSVGTHVLTTGAVSIDPTSIANTSSVGTHAVLPGAALITATSIASTSSIFAPDSVAAGVVTITCTSITNASSIFAPDSVAAGVVTITCTSITNASTFGTHAVNASVVLAPTVVNDPDQVGTHTLTQVVAVTAVTNSSSVGTHAVNASIVLAPTVVNDPDQVGSHTVGATTPIGGASFTNTPSVGTHVVTAGAVTVAATVISNTSFLGVHTVDSGQTIIGPASITNASTVGTHVLTTGVVSIATASISNTSSVGSHAVSTGQSLVGPTSITNTQVIGTTVVTSEAFVVDATVAYPNLVANGTFETDTVWTKVNSATIDGGVATLPQNSGVRQDGILTEGVYYRIRFDLTVRGAGNVYFYCGTTSSGDPTYAAGFNTSGPKEVILRAKDQGYARFHTTNIGGEDFDIDNVVVSEATSNELFGPGLSGIATITPASLLSASIVGAALRWWENGVTNDLRTGAAMAGVPSTSSEQVGTAFSEVWNPVGDNQGSILPIPTDWHDMTIAFVFYWPASTDGNNMFHDTVATRWLAYEASQTSMRAGIGGGLISDESPSVGWHSHVYVIRGTGAGDGEIFLDGSSVGVGTPIATPPTAWGSCANFGDVKYACFVVADKAWDAEQIAAFHNGGDFASYQDLLNPIGAAALTGSFVVGASVISNSSVLGAPTAVYNQTVTATALENSSTVGSHIATLGAGTQYITPGTIFGAASVGTHTVTPGALSIDPAVISNVSSVGSHTLTSAVTIDPGVVGNTSSLGAHTVTPGVATITASAISNLSSIGVHQLDASGSIAIGVISNSSVLGDVTAVYNQTVTGTAITNASTVGLHTVTLGAGTQYVTPGVIVDADFIGTHTAIPGAATVAPAAITDADTLGAALLTRVVAAISVTNASSLDPPTAVYNQTVTASVIGSTGTIGSHIVTLGAGVQYIVPASIANAGQVGTHTLLPGGVLITTTTLTNASTVGSAVVAALSTVEPTSISNAHDYGTATFTTFVVVEPSYIQGSSIAGVATLSAVVDVPGVTNTSSMGDTTAVYDQDITATSIPSTAAVGSHVVNLGAGVQFIQNAAVGSDADVLFDLAGVLAGTVSIDPTSISNASSLGAAEVGALAGITPVSIPSTSAVSALADVQATYLVTASSISGTTSLGTALLTREVVPLVIGSVASVGAATVHKGAAFILPSVIPSSLVFGTAVVTGPVVVPFIPSATVFTAPVLGQDDDRSVSVPHIPSTATIGTHEVDALNVIYPKPISESADVAYGPADLLYGTDDIVFDLAGAAGEPEPSLIREIDTTALTNPNATGTALLTLYVTPTGIASVSAVFAPSGALNVSTVTPEAIIDPESFGSAQLDRTISSSTLPNTSEIGTATLGAIILPSSVTNTSSVGSHEAGSELVVRPPVIVTEIAEVAYDNDQIAYGPDYLVFDQLSIQGLPEPTVIPARGITVPTTTNTSVVGTPAVNFSGAYVPAVGNTSEVYEPALAYLQIIGDAHAPNTGGFGTASLELGPAPQLVEPSSLTNATLQWPPALGQSVYPGYFEGVSLLGIPFVAKPKRVLIIS